jgi:Zn-dependent peptidase ImmA (M78 family)/transcriptional regulator with XRE-family HTH domain
VGLRPLESWDDVGSRVAEARDAARLTQSELATRIGIERTALAKIESGKRGLSSLELARLASELDRPIEWFVAEPPPAVVSRRASSLHPPDDLDVLVDVFARDVELLIEIGALRPPGKADRGPAPRTLRQAEALAAQMRVAIGEAEGPIRNLAAKAEALGLYVASIELSGGVPDGAYVALNDAGASVVNGTQDAGRRRFTLAHELGHHVIADEYSTDWAVDEPRDERERRVNAFAIHFLMPRASVTRDWTGYGGQSDPRRAAIRLACEYRVSWTAACGQLQNLGLVDRRLAEQLRASRPNRADFLELGLYVVEELTPPELSPQFASGVVRAYRGHKIAAGRAVELLRGSITEEELPDVDAVPLEALRGELETSE